MKELEINLERLGTERRVGCIRYTGTDDARFQYEPSYLEAPDATAISIGLPLRAEAFSPRETKCFFEGLLPEGFHRRTIAERMRVREEDYLSLLSGLGDECLGAIRVSVPGKKREAASYEPLSDAQMTELARDGAVKSAEWLTKTHLSLAGASGKTGLYYDEEADRWYLPFGEAPSTHIVKQSHLRLEDIVANEQLCLLTARQLGINVPDSFVVTPQDAGPNLLFATKRYDRVIDAEAEKISGKKRPYRLHQEDFAQALGIEAADKYEPEGGRYLEQAFRLLLMYSADPMTDQTKLWDITLYDFLIGNTDNHIKNLSLLYEKQMRGIRLAPVYDRISTAVYESSTRDMAMSIGGQICLDEMTRASFAEEADRVGLGTKMATDRLESMCDRFEAALREQAKRLAEQGVGAATKLAERILCCGGFRRL